MPLYTYIVTYKGSSYVVQDRKSNFKGFVSSWTDIPANALPGLNANLLKELMKKLIVARLMKFLTVSMFGANRLKLAMLNSSCLQFRLNLEIFCSYKRKGRLKGGR